MGGYIALGALGILAALVAVIVIRTICFKPEKLPPVEEEVIALDHDKIIKDMSDMIRCKTVSYRDESLVDRKEFEKFGALPAYTQRLLL